MSSRSVTQIPPTTQQQLVLKPSEIDTVATVTHVHKVYDVYIGRRTRNGLKESIWHNQFRLADRHNASDRAAVIARYRDWLLFSLEPRAIECRSKLQELRGKRLGCWCHPLPCHGDVLVEFVNSNQFKTTK